ncbi:WbqC family protein [Bacteroides thetaiotaomicron]|uniref:WbqC family protein n=1 Tax=Bacteroides thetaiotaomicron TaxID=818 RepID=UPI002164F410|nr:WbqC family protein [Bacteroides thetaiotaomicron]MCS2291973.1 WbqC family protein [Bacteroides thetaiotaomicron]MCS2863901.1 WbqC family protein [Bacteroides thetaiotaomicron]MCS3354510.1 WbqC family protein [Bacteroides thetaiotaomicron]
MKAVDKYVVYDDVNYIKGGWGNRNHILINGEKKCSLSLCGKRVLISSLMRL